MEHSGPVAGREDAEGGNGAQATVKTVTLHLQRMPAGAAVTVERVDNEHGNVLPLYEAMGRPSYPTPAQVEDLNRRTALPEPDRTKLRKGELELRLEPNALVLVRVSAR